MNIQSASDESSSSVQVTVQIQFGWQFSRMTFEFNSDGFPVRFRRQSIFTSDGNPSSVQITIEFSLRVEGQSTRRGKHDTFQSLGLKVGLCVISHWFYLKDFERGLGLQRQKWCIRSLGLKVGLRVASHWVYLKDSGSGFGLQRKKWYM